MAPRLTTGSLLGITRLASHQLYHIRRTDAPPPILYQISDEKSLVLNFKTCKTKSVELLYFSTKKKEINQHTYYYTQFFINLKFYFSSWQKGVFMNNEKNQKIWMEKIRENMQLRGRSKNTFLNYRCALNRFFKYYSSDIKINKLKEEDIIIYLKERLIEKNMSSNTYNLNVAAIRLFYLVCFKVSLSRLLIPNCNTDKKIPTILSKKDFISIFNKENNLKHKCWLILAFCSGLRVHEIAKLKIDDLSSKEHKIRVLGKGKKERYTILPDISIKILALYCKKYNIKFGYLFPAINNKEHMNCKTIINYFSSLKRVYNLNSNISLHSLRHSFATYYLSNGGSLLTLQSMLGHSNLNTTTIYLHLSQNFNELDGIKYV